MSGIRIGSPFGYRNGINQNSLYGTIYNSQLLNGLQMVLDAGDALSWGGKGVWQDLGPSSLKFNPVGSTPTFHGSVGGCTGNEYFSSSGSNSWVCASGIPNFLQAVHKPNATYSFLAAVNFPSWNEDANSIIDDFINGTSQPLGFRYQFGHVAAGQPNSNKIDIQIGQDSGGGGPVFTQQAGSTMSFNTWHIVGLSMNVPAHTGFFYKDGNLDTAAFSVTYTNPTSSNNPANFNIAGACVSGTQMAFVGIWSIPLAKADFDVLFAALRGRFGI